MTITNETRNLKHIKIAGFKSIAHLDLPLGNINILIGANGAGKSNFISLFTFLSHLSQGKLKSYIATEGGADTFFHFGTRATEQMRFDLFVGINGYHVTFSPNFADDSLVFREEYCTINSSTKQYALQPRYGESGFAYYIPPESYYVSRYTRDYLEQCRVYHFHDTSNQAAFKKTQPVDSHAYLEKDAANLAPFLYHLRTSKNPTYRQAYQQIVATIRTIAPFFHDFYLEPSGAEDNENILLRWTHTQREAPFSAHTLSDGTARFICMATLFLQPADLRPATIILDEPELGLHPAALEVLADVIQTISPDTQVICSTQSVALANLFAPEDFIVVDAHDGVSSFQRLEKEPLAQWLETYGMGDIWRKNLIGGRPAW